MTGNSKLRLGFALLLWAALASPSAAGEAQRLCPVLTDEPIDPRYSVEHEGRKVYFCCQKCRRKFQADPAPYLANLPPADGSGEAGEEPHPGGHGEHAHEKGEGVLRLVDFAGKLHPAAVHFPIALIAAAALAEMLRWRRPHPLFAEAARFCLLLGAPAAVLAALLGWAAGRTAGHSGSLETVFLLHQWIGIATAVLAVIAAACLEARRRGRAGMEGPYRVVLLAGALLALAAGALGGLLVHGLEHYAW